MSGISKGVMLGIMMSVSSVGLASACDREAKVGGVTIEPTFNELTGKLDGPESLTVRIIYPECGNNSGAVSTSRTAAGVFETLREFHGGVMHRDSIDRDAISAFQDAADYFVEVKKRYKELGLPENLVNYSTLGAKPGRHI